LADLLHPENSVVPFLVFLPGDGSVLQEEKNT